MHECGEGPPGAARCARKLSAAVHDWVCFNDKEVTGKPYQRGASALTALLHRRLGRFGGGGLPNASSGWLGFGLGLGLGVGLGLGLGLSLRLRVRARVRVRLTLGHLIECLPH